MQGLTDVVAVVPDLFFQSRILAAARAAGRHVTFTSAGPATDFALALVDLDAPGALGAIRDLRSRSAAPIIAFGPHVETEKRKAARKAGADRVLAKSKFVTELPRLLAADEAAAETGA